MNFEGYVFLGLVGVHLEKISQSTCFFSMDQSYMLTVFREVFFLLSYIYCQSFAWVSSKVRSKRSS